MERQRLQYLELLGIETYVPRRILPGAAASIQLSDEQIGPMLNVVPAPTAPSDQSTVMPESPAYEAEATASLDVSKEENSSPISLLDTVAEGLVAKKIPDSQKDIQENSTQPSANESTETAKNLQFVLNVWRIRDELLVIDSRQPGAAYPTDRLLQNMLRAIGYPLVQLPNSEIIRWPLFIHHKNNKSITQQNQDVEQARAMVQAYINAQTSQFPIKALLCMGDNAVRFSLSENNTEADVESRVGSNATLAQPWNIPVAKTPSLFELLQDPPLKAKAWAALQTIIVTPY